MSSEPRVVRTQGGWALEPEVEEFLGPVARSGPAEPIRLRFRLSNQTLLDIPMTADCYNKLAERFGPPGPTAPKQSQKRGLY